MLGQAREARSHVSTRDALFRAATYFRTADFFLHNNWDDPRIQTFWDRNIEAFREAISLLPTPGLRKVLGTPYGFDVPIYWFPASGDARVKRPTLMMHIGFDAGAEETYHTHGRAALERGYNVSSLPGDGFSARFIGQSQRPWRSTELLLLIQDISIQPSITNWPEFS